jgi:hypothetical protein
MSARTGVATLCYVYAVARDTPELDAIAGGLGAVGPAASPLRAVRAEGWAAFVSDVPADRFGEEGLRAQLDDLGRLEQLARAHHEVVAALFGTLTVLPMRLASVYADDAGVRGMLALSARTFEPLLQRLDGRREFGVKVYAEPRPVARTPAVGGPAASGRDYLRMRRAQREGERRSYGEAEAMAERVLERAGQFAVACVRHRPQPGVLSSAAGENVANLAFLVPAAQEDAFRAALDALGSVRPGVRVEVTGPWAPYSFATTAAAQEETHAS